MSDPNNDKKKKGPKLFKPGNLPSSDEDKPKGPKLFKPGGDSNSPSPSKDASKPKGPKLFKPGGDTPKSSPSPSKDVSAPKGPKLFKPSGTQPKEEPKKPALFKPSAPSPQPSTKKTPSLFKTDSKPSTAPSMKSSSDEKDTKVPSAAPPIKSKIPPAIQAKKPKLFSAGSETPVQKDSKPMKEPKEKAKKEPKPKKESKKKKPKVSKSSKKDEKKDDEKKGVSAMDLLSLTDDEDVAEEISKKKTSATASDLKAALEPKKKKEPQVGQARSFLRQQLYLEVDVRKMYYKAMFAGAIGVVLMLIIIYLISCFDSSTFLENADFLTGYSQGNSINEAVGIWTIAYTPVSAFEALDPMWAESWYFHLAPVLIVAVIISWQIKNPKYAALSVFFFVVFSIILSFAMLTILPIFGIVQPNTVDAGLIASFPEVVGSWDTFTQTISVETRSIFFAWMTMGALQQGAVALAAVIPISILFALASQILNKNK